MIKFIADTNIIGRFFFGRDEKVSGLVTQLDSNKMAISIVTKFEIRNWISNHLICSKEERIKIVKIVNSLPVVHLSNKCSVLAEKISNQNINAKLADSLIAATCLENKLPLLTLNKKDFKKLTGIKLL